MTDSRRVKLRALDGDDLQVLSACLQDALVPLGEVTFLKKERRFVLVANRFKWEVGGDPAEVPQDDGARAKEAALSGAGEPEDARFEDEEPPPPYERTNCGICFDKVLRVRFRGLDRGAKNQILNLLAIELDPTPPSVGKAAIDLVFSEGAAIRLEVAGVSCHLEDLGEPWPTRWHPIHDPEPSDKGARGGPDQGEEPGD